MMKRRRTPYGHLDISNLTISPLILVSMENLGKTRFDGPTDKCRERVVGTRSGRD
ncbi:unnamed protein product [Brassica rapa subsp. trilocularis]